MQKVFLLLLFLCGFMLFFGYDAMSSIAVTINAATMVLLCFVMMLFSKKQ